MNKTERQERHRQRLERKKERERIESIYRNYWYVFEAEALRLLRELPKRSFDHPYSVSLLYMPSLRNHVHCRLEWSDESVLFYQKTWLFDADEHHYIDAPQGPDDPRLPDDYWRDVKPTFEEKRETLPLEVINVFKELIADLQLPIQTPIPNDICCDGECHELRFAHGHAISTWKWHNEAPEPWKELENVVAIVRNIFSF